MSTYEENYRAAPNYELEIKYSELRQAEAAIHILKNSPRKILEIGSGLNPISNYVSNSIENGWELVILEPDPEFYGQLTLLSSINRSIIPKLSTLQDYVKDMSEEITFDFIIINCLLQEIEDPLEFLWLAKTILHKNGKIWISVPNANSLHKRFSRIENEFQKAFFGRKWNFTAQDIEGIVSRTGGRIVLMQSRILKPFPDDQLKELMNDIAFPTIFKLWLEYKSIDSQLGAEIDFLIEYN